MMSCANVRDIPYLMSAQVTGEPSCQVGPVFMVKVQVLLPLLALPVSVARSGTSLLSPLSMVSVR